MTPELKRHLKIELSVNGLTNAFFNGAIAWLLIKDKGLLEWWGVNSFAIDVLATAFLLPFIVALIIIPIQRRKVSKAKISGFVPDRSVWLEKLALHWPDSLFLSALYFGLAGILVIAPLTLLGILVLGIDSFSPLHYSVFKGLWAGVLAALLALPMILVGLRIKA